jgi:hypothetical protein
MIYTRMGSRAGVGLDNGNGDRQPRRGSSTTDDLNLRNFWHRFGDYIREKRLRPEGASLRRLGDFLAFPAGRRKPLNPSKTVTRIFSDPGQF